MLLKRAFLKISSSVESQQHCDGNFIDVNDVLWCIFVNNLSCWGYKMSH